MQLEPPETVLAIPPGEVWTVLCRETIQPPSSTSMPSASLALQLPPIHQGSLTRSCQLTLTVFCFLIQWDCFLRIPFLLGEEVKFFLLGEKTPLVLFFLELAFV